MLVSKDRGVTILLLTSDDLSNPQASARILENLLVSEGDKKIIADLAKIDTMYSLQIGTLVAMHVMCYENVAVMKLANANERVKSLLKMVGLDSMMQMHYGVDVARQSFGS